MKLGILASRDAADQASGVIWKRPHIAAASFILLIIIDFAIITETGGNMKGTFITIEGPDGAGKSTAAAHIRDVHRFPGTIKSKKKDGSGAVNSGFMDPSRSLGPR